MLAAGALVAAPLVGAAPALAADEPSVTVSPDTELDAEGPNTLTVTGEGFTPGSPGVYAAVGPAGLLDVPNFHLNADLFDGAEWVRSIESDGSFTQELTLEAAAFDSDGTSVDCTETECGVYTWAAHGSDDRSQDTYTPIKFAEVEEETPDVTVTVSPSSDLDPEEPNTLTVTGEGFTPGSPGIYVAVGPKDVKDNADWTSNSRYFTAVAWIRSVSDDGTINQDITLDSPAYEANGVPVNCTETECGVYTWAAHGSDDRSQDTYTPIKFAEVEEETPDVTVTVSPDTELAPEEPNTLTVTGEGFTPGSPGIYVAVGPKDVKDNADWASNPRHFTAVAWIRSVSDDGTINQDITLDSPAYEANGVPVNCTETECGVYTWAAHGSDDRSQDTYTPIKFAEVEEETPDVTVTVSPDTELAPEEPNTLTVTGEGFTPGSPGIYVAVGPKDVKDNADWASNPRHFTAVAWIRSVSDDGTINQDIILDSPAYEANGVPVNCTETECGVYTWAAHGSDDRSQDTYTPIKFAEVEEETPDVTVTVSPDTELAPEEPNTLTVTGEGFTPGSPGIYVAVGPKDVKDNADWASNPRHFTAVAWIRSVSDDGTINQDITLDSPAYEANGVPVNCTETECGVYTWAAHGSDDRSQDTYTPIKFAEAGEGPGDGGDNGGGDDKDETPGTGEDDDETTEVDKCFAVTSGEFAWGIHAGFIDYVTGGIANGSITPNGVPKKGNEFNFKYQNGDYDSAKQTGIVKFSGSVKFTGHNGELDVTLANPQFHINKNKATVLLDVTTSGKFEKNVPFAVVDLKNAKATATGFTATAANAVLTDEGSAAMQDFYKPGSAVAPVTVSFKLDGAGDCSGKVEEGSTGGSGSGAGTGDGDDNSKTSNVNLTANKGSDTNENVAMCRSTRGASLNWGVKQSFSDYVTGLIANGSIQRANGVSGSFNWPGRTASFNPDTGTGQFGFGGTVTFSGHDGALNMRISNPRVQIVSSSQARLYADVRSTNPAGEVTVDARGVHIANLNVSGKKSVSGDTITFSSVAATRTSAGVPAYAAF